MFEAFEASDGPEHLRRNVERHWESLCALVDTFGKAGIDEERSKGASPKSSALTKLAAADAALYDAKHSGRNCTMRHCQLS